MATEKVLRKFGFMVDENNLKLKEFFNNLKPKEIHIDIYSENPLVVSSEPFMLLSRIIEKNVIMSSNNDRFVLKKNDEYETILVNILFSKITKCHYKIFENYSEFILNVQNIYYKITVLN